MKSQILNISSLLDASERGASRLSLLALLTLGVVESLLSGQINANEAVQLYFNFDNCMAAKKQVRNKILDEIMSRGSQLPDIIEILPPDKSQQQFQVELNRIRDLCHKLLPKNKVAA